MMNTIFKNHHTQLKSSQQRHLLQIVVTTLILTTLTSTQETTCSDPKATLYSGYLDSKMFYGTFKRDQNTSIAFKSPFSGQLNLTQASVMLWAKVPLLSIDGSLQRGRYFECNNTIQARLDNSTVQMNVTQNFNYTNGTINSTLVRQTANVRQFANDLTQLQKWNHFSFSFRDKKMRIHFNGIQVSEVLMNYTVTNTTRNADTCVIGNSILQNDPINAFIRHFIMLNTGHSSNVNLEQRIRSVYLPSESNVLVYFKFDKYFNRQETYQYNSTRAIKIQNFTIESSDEPEQTCYCTQFTPSTFIRLNQSFMLDDINLPDMNNTFQNISQYGFTFQIWLFPLNISNTQKNMSLIRISDQIEILISSQSQQFIMRISDPQNNIYLDVAFNSATRLTFNYWFQYTFVITLTESILYVDGIEASRIKIDLGIYMGQIDQPLIDIKIGENLDSLVYKISLAINPANLPDNTSQQILNTYTNHINSTATLSSDFFYILNAQLTRDQLVHDQDFSLDQRLFAFDQVRGAYFSSSYQAEDNSIAYLRINPNNINLGFKFEQNNLLCTEQTTFKLQEIWDGQVCQNQRYSPYFNNLNAIQNPNMLRSPSVQAQITGNLSQITIDVWIKMNFTNNDGILDKNYQILGIYPPEQSNTNMADQALKLQLNFNSIFDDDLQQITNTTTSFVCSNSIKENNQTSNSQISTSPLLLNYTWLHVACSIETTNSTEILQSQVYSQLANQDAINGSLSLQKRMISNYSVFDVYLGTDNQLLQQFSGYIRELRIFNATMNTNMIRAIRYQKLPVIYQSKLLAQYSLENGYEQMSFISSTNNPQLNQFQLMHQYLDYGKYSWVKEDSLVVCGQGFFFNGQCCSQISFTPRLSYQETDIQIIVNSTLLSFDYLDATSNFSWSLVSVIPNNTNYFNALNTSLQSQRLGQSLVFNKQSLFRNRTFVLQVSITNIYQAQSIDSRIGIVLKCPLMSINNTLNPIIHPWGYINKLAIQAIIRQDCYSNSITVKSINWTNSSTGVLGNPFTLSTDKTIVTYSNESRIKNDSDMWLNVSVQFSNNQVINETKIVRFLSRPVILNISPDTFYLLSDQTLEINVNQTQFLVNTVSRNEQTFMISCSNKLTYKNQSQICVINQATGIFRLSSQDLVNPIIPYVDYAFNISAGKQNTSLLDSRQIIARWYNLGQYGSSCPDVQVLDYFNVSKNNLTIQLHTPKVILDCIQSDEVSTKRYSRVNVSYELDQATMLVYQQIYNMSLGVKNFNETFELLNDNYTFRVRNNNTIISRIKVGDLIPINMTMYVLDLTDNITILKVQKILNINILFSDLVVVSNITTDKLGNLPFEQDLIIDASQSYDPAFNISSSQTNTSMLTYIYTCNNDICQLNASQMNKGVLRLTTLDVLRLGYQYNQPYNFSIAINNPLIFRQALMYANYTVYFNPPNKVGTQVCPRIYYYKQNSTNSTTRLTNYTFNTMNASDSEIKVAYENCDTLVYIPQVMVLDFPIKQISQSYIKQQQSKTFNQSSFQLSQSQLLSNLDIFESQTVKATLVYNYTVNKVSKIGYTTSEFQINRTYSRLMPKTIPNTIDNKVQVGFEDYIFIDSSQSYDPDKPYITKNYTDFTILRNCSANIQSLCTQLDQIQDFNLTKSLRKQFNIQSVGSVFWIQLRLVAPNRTSAIENITYEVTKQDYLKCIQLSDSFKNIQINLDEIKVPIIIQPTLQVTCGYIYVSDKMIWSTDQSTQFWSSNQFFNYAISISPSQLKLLPYAQDIQLSVQSQFKIVDNLVDNFQSSRLNYTIRILLPDIKANIDAEQPLDTSDDSSIITASLINLPANKSTKGMTCKFQCSFQSDNTQDCGIQDLCQFDYMPTFRSFSKNNSFTYSYYMIIVNIFLDNQTYTAKKVLNVRSSEIAPSCSVAVKQNIDIQIEKPTVFQSNCINYNISSLQYFWYIIDQQLISSLMNDMQSQSIKFKENAFLNLQGQDFVLQVKTELTKFTAHDCLSSYIISLPNNDNILLGNLSLDLSSVVMSQTIYSLEFQNYTDSEGGDLFFSIRYETIYRNYTLVTKTIMQKLLITIPECIKLYIYVFDSKGSLKIQTIDMSQLQLQPIDQTSFVNFYNQIQALLTFDITNNESFFYRTPETLMNIMISAIQLLKDNQGGYDSDLILYYKQDIYQKLKDINDLSAIYNGIEDARVNTQVQMIRGIHQLTIDNNLEFLTRKSQDIYTLLTKNVNIQYLSNNSYEIQHLNTEYVKILTTIKPFLNLSVTEAGNFNQTQAASYEYIYENLLNEEVVKMNSQNWTFIKLIKDEISKDDLEFDAYNVQFQISSSILKEIDVKEMLISVKILNESLFELYQNDNMTRLSNVYDISVTDMDSQKIRIQNKTSIIVFNNIDTTTYQNIECGYFNEITQQWEVDSNDELVTQVVEKDNQVYCQTQHLSIFTIFNITTYPDDDGTIPSDPNRPKDPLDNDESKKQNERVVIFSIIQIGIILIGFIILAISAKFELEKRLIFAQNDYTKLQSRLSLRTIFKNFAHLFIILSSDKLNFLPRALIFINYLLVVSFWTLVNIAVHKTLRSLGDEIFLIITNICIATFLSPIIRQLMVYKFYQFVPMQQFSQLPKEYSHSNVNHSQNNGVKGGPSMNNKTPLQIYDDLEKININIANQIPASTQSNLKKSQLSKGYQSHQQLHTSQNLMNMSDSPIGHLDIVNQHRDELTSSKLKERTAPVTIEDDSKTQANQYRSQRYKPSGLINMDETEQNLKQPEFENDFENESHDHIKNDQKPSRKSRRSSLIDIDLISSEDDQQHPFGFSDRNIQQLSMQLNKHSLNKQNNTISDENEEDDDDQPDFQFEGGSDEENNGPSLSGNRLNSQQQAERQLRYQINSNQEQNHNVHDLSGNMMDVSGYEEKVNVRQITIAGLQFIGFMLFAVLNGYLFYEVDISNSAIIRSYIGVVLVSIIVQFVIIDFIICLLASYYISNVKLGQLSQCQSIIVFTFITVNMIRSL